ncbi:MAG: group 1 glycosyl transferase [Parcubacteria group bacterium LiPW_41]|nr:MAG: group 1 glycosyl transferase [Parcubacteria group bacterium LiPW_41]
MNILIDARLLTRGHISGIEDYARGVINEMLSNHTEHNYAFFWSGIKKVDFPKEWRLPNVSVINWVVPNRMLDIFIRVFEWPKIDAIWPADIIWSPHFFLLPKPKSAKRIITFHDLSPEHFPNLYPFRKRVWHWQQNYRAQMNQADHLIAVSEFTKKDIVTTFGISEKKVTAIHSGINPFFKHIEKTDSGLRLFQNANNLTRPYFLFVGTLEPRKNISGIIRAFSLFKEKEGCKDFELIIVGKKGWLFNSIFNEAKQSPFSSDIRFWGEVSYDELRYLYNGAFGFLWPSLFEGFGHPPLEAQACGVPVIASNRSSLPEVLQDSALLTSPQNIEEIVVAMEELVLHNEVREALIARGYENIKRFSWRATSDSLIKVIESIHNARQSSNKKR